MGANHDLLAERAGSAIVSKITTRIGDWPQIFSDQITKIGDFSWPRPDYVCYDYELEQSIAFEFKPPNQSKREYLTGLGQTLSYLEKHHYSGLILPEIVEGVNLAQQISNILSLDVFAKSLITVVGYNERLLESDPLNAVRLYKSISDHRTGEIVRADISETYWCWWRDMSHYEVFQLLCLLDIYSAFEGDIYSEYVWPEFWKLLTTSRTKGWDGNPRDKTDTEASAKSEKQNYKIPLVQLGLIEPSEGRLTVLGYKLVSIGKIYGVSSSIFVDFLTKLVLVEGKHLILIQDLEHFRMTANKEKFINQEIFRVEFENFLVENKSIGPRKPGRVTTGKKFRI